MAYLEKAKIKSDTTNVSIEDCMATLNRFTSDTISQAIKDTVKNKKIKIFTSGGGMHNPLLIEHLKESLPRCVFNSTEKLGIDPDAKEAILFAILANECIAGANNYTIKSATIVPAIAMGKISFPG
jgi:anhydro-N-acetylmuramic acid kinase